VSQMRNHQRAAIRAQDSIVWKPFVAAMLLLLPACAATRFMPVASDGRTGSSHATVGDSDCGENGEKVPAKGGSITIPAVPSSGNDYGSFKYAPLDYASLNPNIAQRSTFQSCLYDIDNVPVPTGYRYDWFGEWNIDAAPGSFSFGDANLTGRLYSDLWVKKRQYFLFLYTAAGTFIESYPIGSVDSHQRLEFNSPFENGLVYPGTLALEIVHPAESGEPRETP
jgi:hypothetical protein